MLLFSRWLKNVQFLFTIAYLTMDSRDPSSLERKALNVPCRPARLAWKTRQSAPNSCVLCQVPATLFFLLIQYGIWCVSPLSSSLYRSAKTPSGYRELTRKPPPIYVMLQPPSYATCLRSALRRLWKTKNKSLMIVSMRLSNIGNVFTTGYTERQAFCPVVRIVSHHPLTRKRVLLPPPPGSGGGGHTR